MPKRTDIYKILIIGSGPIIIGQACEFDYSGTQACKALKEEGYEVVLVNSNPATIMTDPGTADKTYIEPLTVESLEEIIKKEKQDKIHVLAPNVIESIDNLKKNILNTKAVSMDLEETLIALSISATTNPTAQFAMEKLRELRGCEVHMTHIPTPGDEAGLRKLGVNTTSDPNFSTKTLFVE